MATQNSPELPAADSAAVPSVPAIRSVRILCVPGGRYAEIEHARGTCSVQIVEADPVRALFALADEEGQKASAAMRRANILRDAAWFEVAQRNARKTA